MKRRGIRRISSSALSGMKRTVALPLDRIERTLLFARNRLESFGDIAFHTGIEQSWIESFSARGREVLQSADDANNVDILHDWFFSTELACPRQRVQLGNTAKALGRAAVCEDRQRLGQSASVAANEKRHVHQRATRRLDDMERVGKWHAQSGDGMTQRQKSSYVSLGRKDDKGLASCRGRKYCGELDDFTLPTQEFLFE